MLVFSLDPRGVTHVQDHRIPSQAGRHEIIQFRVNLFLPKRFGIPLQKLSVFKRRLLFILYKKFNFSVAFDKKNMTRMNLFSVQNKYEVLVRLF